MTLPNLQSFIYRVVQDGELSYVESPATQAGGSFSTILTLAANASNILYSVVSQFPAVTSALVTTLLDITTPVASGFSISWGSGQIAEQIRAGSLISWGSTGLPSFYLTNLSATLPIQLKLTVTAQ